MVFSSLMRERSSEPGEILGSSFEGAVVFAPDILGRQFDVDHGRMDLRMPHEPHQGGHGDTGTDHVGAESVTKPVRPSIEDLSGPPMVTKQRAQARRSHRFAAMPPL